MSGLIQLQAFVTAHPPHPDNQRPTAAQLARYAELLPAPLLELWREHGLGYYGERRLWLLWLRSNGRRSWINGCPTVRTKSPVFQS